MAEQRPDFSRLKMGRKGYDADQVDEFVGRVLHRINTDRTPSAMASAELGIIFFDEARGQSAYDPKQVDTWLSAARERIEYLETHAHEEDIPQQREGSVVDMPAPPHFADRFPRVSRSVLGFAVSEVDQVMEQLREDLLAGRAPSAEQILGMAFSEENGGYRQVAVAQVLELIALARRAQ